MKKILRTAKALLVICSIVAVTYSCSDDTEKEFDEQGLNKTDVSSVLSVDVVSGLTDSVLTDVFAANSQSGKSSSANKTSDCFETTFTNAGYTVTFDNCSVDGADNVNGTIAVAFAVENGAIAYSATYTNFSVGDINIEGTKDVIINSSANGNEMSLTITSNMTIIMEDGTVVKETGTKTLVVVQGVSIETSTISISGEWVLQIGSDLYAVAVIDTLGGNLACDYLTSGVMSIAKNGLSVKVNFGEGTCDDSATLIYPNGVEEIFTLED